LSCRISSLYAAKTGFADGLASEAP
jgi:hypothetical protein